MSMTALVAAGGSRRLPASRMTGDLDQALRHWQQALILYKGLEAEQIRVKVSAYSGLRGT